MGPWVWPEPTATYRPHLQRQHSAPEEARLRPQFTRQVSARKEGGTLEVGIGEALAVAMARRFRDQESPASEYSHNKKKKWWLGTGVHGLNRKEARGHNSAQIKRVSLRVLVKVEGRERMATSMAK